MQSFLTDKFAHRRQVRRAVLATAACLMLGATSAWAQAQKGDAFETYKDAEDGIALSKPGAWNVNSDNDSVTTSNSDNSELLLVALFQPKAGDTSEKWLDKLGNQYGERFSHVRIDKSTPLKGAKGDETLALMHYDGPKGQGQIRALVAVVGGKGILYLIAAPASRLAAEQPKLVRMAKSVTFSAPKADPDDAGDKSAGAGDTGGALLGSKGIAGFNLGIDVTPLGK